MTRAIARVALLAALSPASSAASDHDAMPAEIEAGLARGLERYRANDFVAAIEIWTRLLTSVGHERGWKVLYNLGRAHESIGDVSAAVPAYEGFLARWEERPPEIRQATQDARADAATRLASLKARYGALRVRAGSAGLVLVRLGTAEPRPAGFVVYLTPGAHEVELHAGTAAARKLSVVVQAGGLTEVVVDRIADGARGEPAGDGAPAQAATRWTTTWLVVSGAAAVASLALPLALYLRADGRRDEAEGLDRADPRYAEARARFEDARRDYRWSYAAPAILAAATVTIAILRSTRRESGSLAASPLPGGGGLVFAAGF